MKSIPFSTSGKENKPASLTLPETGSYAFNIKLYSEVVNTEGIPTNPPNSGVVVMYLGVWVNNQLQDVSEIFAPFYPFMGQTKSTGTNVTNVILGCQGNAGDKIDIRFGYLASSMDSNLKITSKGRISQAPTSVRTSLLFWKL